MSKRRQLKVLQSQGKGAALAIRLIGGAEVTYYQWLKELCGLKLDEVKRLKELENENESRWHAASNLTVDKMII